jgi:hypothetical protein
VVKKINMHLNDCDKGICPTFFFMLIDNGSLVVSFDLLLWENQVLRKQAFDKNAMEIPKRPKSSFKKKKKKRFYQVSFECLSLHSANGEYYQSPWLKFTLFSSF